MSIGEGSLVVCCCACISYCQGLAIGTVRFVHKHVQVSVLVGGVQHWHQTNVGCGCCPV
jgi:hypothetical protein